MTYLAKHDLWTTGSNRVTTIEPGPGDLFVVTTLGGKRVFLEAIDQYERAVRIAEGFARRIVHDRPVVIRVVPMQMDELLAHMGTTREEFGCDMHGDDAADRQLVIDTCRAVLRECSEPSVRADALEVLTSMGALH